MLTTETRSAPAVRRPSRSTAWVLLMASAAAVSLTGLAATALVLYPLLQLPDAILPTFWIGLLAASGLTLASLGLRALRWIFLLRRSEIRIPIRDAYIGYLAGLSLLLAPLMLGEVAVRAYIHRSRGRVPIATTVVVNLWERLLDFVALVGIAGALPLLSGRADRWSVGFLALVALTMVGPVRRLLLRLVMTLARPVTHFDHQPPPIVDRLAQARTWLVALMTSIVSWMLPGLAFWVVAVVWGSGVLSLSEATATYAASTLSGGLSPGGVLVTGGRLLVALRSAGLPDAEAALSVVGIRLATVGVATVLGAMFVLIHWRTRPGLDSGHFDAIAEAYDVQIPERRRKALLQKKTALMEEVLAAYHRSRHGLDVGCGQGWHVARMRELDFDVTGIDSSEEQVHFASRRVGPGIIASGSALDIPAPNDTYDFAYVINVLHHLSSVREQQAAFVELFRVLKPGGLLFVHEINTRNVFFRFYMGYVFPSLNCIDEGVERWLLPGRLADYTDAAVIDTRYFTFLPDFIPQSFASLFAPLERLLEQSPLRVYSAHYMAVLRKPG